MPNIPRFANVTDEARYEANVAAGHKLCARCDGCGNELYSMYRRCQDCGGSGQARERDDSNGERMVDEGGPA